MRIAELILSFSTLGVVAWYTYLTHELLSTQTHQGFENKFFQLLRFHHDIVNAIQLERYGPAGPAPTSGRLAFTTLYNDFLNHYAREHAKDLQASIDSLANAAYDSFYKSNQYCLGHYFRNLYHLIKFVDTSGVSTDEKNFYTHLVRAQLSSDEHLLLFYNGHRFRRFHNLISKYCLLENMPQDRLAGRLMKPPVEEKSLYPTNAYGEP
jgi:hypothetical protein